LMKENMFSSHTTLLKLVDHELKVHFFKVKNLNKTVSPHLAASLKRINTEVNSSVKTMVNTEHRIAY
jgi:predicted transglutaminase-like cysteine proteinase